MAEIELKDRLKEMTREELEALLLAVEEELAGRRKGVSILLTTNGWYDPRKHGHAYVALVRRGANGKIQRKFVDRTNIIYDAKGRTYKAEWVFEAPEGAVIEARLYEGSWKNECREYFRVEADGLKEIEREEALGL